MGLPKSPIKGKKFLERKQEEDWLRRCLPVIVQPELDIRAGHPLECIFFKFRRESEDVSCEVSLIFQGEGTYSPPCCNRDVPPSVSQLMTYGYRTWNRFAYERTADINSFIYLGISFTDRRRPYSDIWMCDASGSSPQRTQSWANGDKCSLSGCATIHNHYILEHSFEGWATWGGGEGSDTFLSESSFKSSPTISSSSSLPQSSTRPLIYLNTCNHMMGFWDANPSLPKFYWTRYCVCRGGRGLAETYATRCIRIKPNFLSLVVCDHLIEFFSSKSDAEKKATFLTEQGIEVKLWEIQPKPVFKSSLNIMHVSGSMLLAPLTRKIDRTMGYKKVPKEKDNNTIPSKAHSPPPSTSKFPSPPPTPQTPPPQQRSPQSTTPPHVPPSSTPQTPPPPTMQLSPQSTTAPAPSTGVSTISTTRLSESATTC